MERKEERGARDETVATGAPGNRAKMVKTAVTGAMGAMVEMAVTGAMAVTEHLPLASEAGEETRDGVVGAERVAGAEGVARAEKAGPAFLMEAPA
jgi:hypothetical protein